MRRFRQLIRETGDFDQARAALRAEMAQAKRRLTFDEQLQRVADGKAKIAPVVTIRRSSPEMTLGGVVGEVL
jgi:hypothetical protein